MRRMNFDLIRTDKKESKEEEEEEAEEAEMKVRLRASRTNNANSFLCQNTLPSRAEGKLSKNVKCVRMMRNGEMTTMINMKH